MDVLFTANLTYDQYFNLTQLIRLKHRFTDIYPQLVCVSSTMGVVAEMNLTSFELIVTESIKGSLSGWAHAGAVRQW